MSWIPRSIEHVNLAVLWFDANLVIGKHLDDFSAPASSDRISAFGAGFPEYPFVLQLKIGPLRDVLRVCGPWPQHNHHEGDSRDS